MRKLIFSAATALAMVLSMPVVHAQYDRMEEGRHTGNIGAGPPTNTFPEIYTHGRWGDGVPVFRDQRSYFNARDRNIIENVVCRLYKGQSVKFKPYRDWGVGEVEFSIPAHPRYCKGWIDRGVVR